MGYLLFGVGLALVVALAIYLHQPPVPQRAAPQQRNEDEDEDEFEGTMEKKIAPELHRTANAAQVGDAKWRWGF